MPLWEPFVAHAESLRAGAEAMDVGVSAPHPELLGTLGVPALVVGEEMFDEMPAGVPVGRIWLSDEHPQKLEVVGGNASAIALHESAGHVVVQQ